MLLDRAATGRVAAVVAPPGSGKTTALRQWALEQPPGRVRWLASHPRHNTASELAATFCSLLDRASASTLPPSVVVVDDVQELHDDVGCAELVTLIDEAPDGWRFVVSGTHLPSPLQRCVLAHGAVVIAAEDLRFDLEEAAALLTASGSDVTGKQTRDVIERNGESAWLRRFLVDTSVLERLSPSLCDHVTGTTGSGGVLSTLSEAGVGIAPDPSDGGWCRYHDGFRAGTRAVLRSERPADERPLLERAAEWHLARDDLEAAVGYLRQLEAWDRLIDEVVERGAAVVHDARSSIESWFRSIPPDVRDRRPEAGLFEAGSDVLRGDSRHVARAVDGIEGSADPGLVAVAEHLRASAEVKEGLLDDALGRLVSGATVDRLTDDQIPRVRGIVSGREDLLAWVRMVRAIARLGTGDVEGAKDDLDHPTTNAGSLWDAGLLAWRSLVDAWSGELTAAERAARRSLKLATELDLHPHTVTAAQLALAHVAICRVDIDGATAVLASIGASGGTDLRPLIDCLLATEQARLALACGHIEQGLTLVSGHELRATAPLFHARARAVEAHLRVAAADLTGARRTLETAGAEIADVAIARVVLALAVDDHDEAHAVLERWPTQPAPRAAWERDVWTAVVAHREGNAPLAERLLGPVVEEAERERHLAIFQSPRNQVTAVARAVYRAAPSPFVRTVIEGVGWAAMPPPVADMVEPLTEREYEVLTLLPTHLSNEEIASRLDISVNTVKTHLKHLYRKFGVKTRSGAVAEAERLRLL